MPRARSLAIACSLTAVVASCVAAPLAARGAVADDAPVPSTAVTAAMAVREGVQRANEQAMDGSPMEVRGACVGVRESMGIGPTCRTPDGLLRVEQADGRSHTVHGLDAPPVGAATFTDESSRAVLDANVGDVSCVEATPGTPRYVLVYARPRGVASRYRQVAPRLRTEVYRLSAFIDAEARSVRADAQRRLPVRCDGGEPVVLDVSLAEVDPTTGSFGAIVDGLVARGFQFDGSGTNDERYVVYYDAPSPTGAAGTGHVTTGDSRPGADNANNRGGLYATEFRYADGGDRPHWEVLLHEVLHTMGAVVSDAPNSSGVTASGSGAGHCTDGQDVLCYVDGGSRASSFDAMRCAVRVIDCGRDDYFHPAPPSDSFLADHWNVAGPANRFLVPTPRVGGVMSMRMLRPDRTRPSRPTQPVAGRRTRTTVVVSWAASSDDVGVTRYVLSQQVGTRWVALRVRLDATQRAVRVVGLHPHTAYRFRVTARDAAGNVSLASRALRTRTR